MPLYPDTLICTIFKSCTVTNNWLRDSLYRDTAPVHIYQLSATVTNSWPLSWLCTATRLMLNLICTRTAKTTPYSPRTPATRFARAGRGVTAYWLKYHDSGRMLRRVTLTNYTAGPLAFMLRKSNKYQDTTRTFK
jgi:hypothetical protein